MARGKKTYLAPELDPLFMEEVGWWAQLLGPKALTRWYQRWLRMRGLPPVKRVVDEGGGPTTPPAAGPPPPGTPGTTPVPPPPAPTPPPPPPMPTPRNPEVPPPPPEVQAKWEALWSAAESSTLSLDVLPHTPEAGVQVYKAVAEFAISVVRWLGGQLAYIFRSGR